MASRLMMSVSGIRGVVGETMTPELILKAASAFAIYAKRGRVIIGRDSRPTGSAIAMNFSSALALSGCDVFDLGIVPTPTVQLMVEELKADGGIVISASHNPIEWNAFKLINKSGTFLNSGEIKKFFSLMDKEFSYEEWKNIGKIEYYEKAADIHIKKITSRIDIAAVRKRKFRVVLDSVNGAGSLITIDLLKKLGCTVIPLYCDISGIFPRGAEPLPENLGDLSKAVLSHSADIGFAQDPDADRLAVVDETGKPIGEENTISLVTEHLLSRKRGRVVVNLSTTKAVEDIAKRYGADFKRTRVGEINVVDEMRKRGARIGGEGNGGVISPEIHLGRDSLAGIGYILEMMAFRKKSVSELAWDIPAYVMKKGKIRFDNKLDTAKIYSKFEKFFPGEKFTRIDGLRIDFRKHGEFRGGWVHLRPSNTEPVFRIIAEGKNKKQASAIFSHFSKNL